NYILFKLLFTFNIFYKTCDLSLNSGLAFILGIRCHTSAILTRDFFYYNDKQIDEAIALPNLIDIYFFLYMEYSHQRFPYIL
ncbi:MAG TPA: hypothetical protein VN704_08750, partial [Verrucomicrobiae bacterium]|nr:hypothetical protein [Verrucomicrobiae bacterium]